MEFSFSNVPAGELLSKGGRDSAEFCQHFLFVGKIWWLVGNPDKLTLVLPRMKLAEFCFGTGGGRWVWLLPGPKAAALRQRPVRRCEGTTASPCSHRDSTGLVSLYPTFPPAGGTPGVPHSTFLKVYHQTPWSSWPVVFLSGEFFCQ